MMVAVVLMATRRRLIRKLQTAQAHDERSAVTLPASRRLEAWWQSRLKAAGVLGLTADGRWWLDRPAWQRYQAARRARGLTILACGLLAGAIVLAVRLFGG